MLQAVFRGEKTGGGKVLTKGDDMDCDGGRENGD